MDKRQLEIEKKNALLSHDLFKLLTAEELNVLIAHAYIRTYNKGQVLFDEGDKREKMYFLLSGGIRIERFDFEGRYNYFNYLKGPELFPLSGIFVNESYHYRAIALSEIELIYFPMALFEETLRKNPQSVLILLKKLSELLMEHEKRLKSSLTSSGNLRIKQTLEMLMTKLGEPLNSQEIALPYPLTIKEIAYLSGTSRETAGKILKELKAKKKITYHYKKFVILDPSYFQKVN